MRARIPESGPIENKQSSSLYLSPCLLSPGFLFALSTPPPTLPDSHKTTYIFAYFKGFRAKDGNVWRLIQREKRYLFLHGDLDIKMYEVVCFSGGLTSEL